jgi:hypothetical protein
MLRLLPAAIDNLRNQGKFSIRRSIEDRVSCSSRFKDNKVISVANEDALEESRRQQPIKF